jgi:hypothetical protein
MLQREEKADMEFISEESRERIITLPDCKDDCITDGNSARAIEARVNSLDMAALGSGRRQPPDGRSDPLSTS